MLPLEHPDRIHVAFDDHRLVANAGLLLPSTLAHHMDLRELVDRHLDLGDAPGRANTPEPAAPAAHNLAVAQPAPRARAPQEPGPLPSPTGSQTLPDMTHPACTGREPVYRRESQGEDHAMSAQRGEPTTPASPPEYGNDPSRHHSHPGDQRAHRQLHRNLAGPPTGTE